eukprot:TRINITY_DN50099_c0_g1_i1.p1 TRINITY_DN50099_c0_g1~~TRINITY_DN50099_c0_g1_i1.p1  ORF type:complete len:223 (-),score=33.70 TRINITY_DN50099_c0_g1_i1:105-725(-)
MVTREKSGEGYGDGPDYWDRRYRNEPSPFEWLKTFDEIQALIANAARASVDVDVLHAGCGTSLLAEDMYDAGYKRIVNIDNSVVAIDAMIERNRKRRPDMKWLQMDATALAFPDGSFDIVLDKSLIDTFACSEESASIVLAYLKEVQRVLRPGGVFLCISYGAPDTRLVFMTDTELSFTVRDEELPPSQSSGRPHYAYIIEKPAAA